MDQGSVKFWGQSKGLRQHDGVGQNKLNSISSENRAFISRIFGLRTNLVVRKESKPPYFPLNTILSYIFFIKPRIFDIVY